jgi:hypothetical protein
MPTFIAKGAGKAVGEESARGILAKIIFHIGGHGTAQGVLPARLRGRTNLSCGLGMVRLRDQGKCVITVLVNFTHGIDRIGWVRTFVGVFYLFLRGMDPALGPAFGIFRDRPSKNLVQALYDYMVTGSLGIPT